MRICIIGHSLIHMRQQLFCKELKKQGHEVLEIYPKQWGAQEREGGLDLLAPLIGTYLFPSVETLERIKEFKPDILFSMTEFWQRQAKLSMAWAKQLGIPLAFFMWENLRMPMGKETRLIKTADLIIAGNSECKKIVERYNKNVFILPQVGISTKLFKPLKTKKKYDLVFAANRRVPEKGRQVVEELAGKGYKILIPMETPYEKMPEFYNKAKLHLCLSYKTKGWVEQFAPFCNIEAMACGLPTLTTDSGAIKEWLAGCKGATFIPEQWSKNNETGFIKEEIERILWEKHYKKRCKEAREFAQQFDNQKVAKELVKVFEKAI